MRLPTGTHFDTYRADHSWWQTKFVWVRMLVLFGILFVVFPLFLSGYWLSVWNLVGYTVLGAMGVQLLIGYCGQITLGHAAFLAVGGYGTAILMLQYHIPYIPALILAAILAGFFSVLFGLPSARVKGFYLIMTTMAAQFIIVDFFISQYVSQIGGRGHYFSLPPGTVTLAPFAPNVVISTEKSVYFLMLVLVILCQVFMANLMRTRVGRAWMAIRDNDIAAEALGVNIVYYKLLAFFVAGFLGGIAGGFWVTSIYFISIEHFTWGWSLWLVGVILIGGVGSMYGHIFGAMFMTLVLELLKFGILGLGPIFPVVQQAMDKFLYIKEAAFGLAICLFLIFEPNGISYRWWQLKNYVHLWPFSY